MVTLTNLLGSTNDSIWMRSLLTTVTIPSAWLLIAHNVKKLEEVLRNNIIEVYATRCAILSDLGPDQIGLFLTAQFQVLL